MMKRLSIYRHLAKTVSYRILGTITTISVAYFFGASVELASMLGLGELLFKPILYFIHERIWYKIPFGIKNETKD
jgi:uncharacterized membrane protein